MHSRILGTLGTICLSATLLAQAPTYTISTVAGSQPSGLGDGGDARSALILSADGIAVDASGNIYISDSVAHRVRKIAAGSNQITNFAGVGVSASGGDGGPATKAGLSSPFGLAVDAAGNLYIAEAGNHIIRKVDTTGKVSTFAGNQGANRYSGDGFKATLSNLNAPHGVAVDKNGVVYIADTSNNRIRSVTTDGIIHTVAGGGVVVGDGGLATQAQLTGPWGIWADPSLNLIIADTGANRVRIVTASDGKIATIAGNGVATGSTITQTNSPGNTQGTGPGGITYTFGTVATLGDGLVGTAATLNGPQQAVIDPVGNLYIADTKNSRVRKIAPAGGVYTNGSIFTFAGCGNACTASLGTANNTTLGSAKALGFDPNGNLLIADNNQVRRVDTTGSLTTAIGVPGFSGDFGPATGALLSNPRGVAVGPDGSIDIADSGNNRIRQILPSGTIVTLAGGPTTGFAGDGNPASFGRINIAVNATTPTINCVAVAPNGDVYFADTGNGRIRKISSGIISTVASGLGGPSCIALDSAFNIYASDTTNSVIRMVDPAGNLSIVAGQLGLKGSGGDGTKAVNALLNAPQGIAVDAQDNLYIADTGNDVVREVLANGTAKGTILYITGSYGSTSSPSSTPGNETRQRYSSSLTGIAVDAAGNIFLADQGNNAVYRIDATALTVATIAGGSVPTDTGAAATAILVQPAAVAVDGSGNVYVTDRTGLIRKLTPAAK